MSEENMSPPLLYPNGPWQVGEMKIEFDQTFAGMPNKGDDPNWEPNKGIQSESQSLNAAVEGTFHRLITAYKVKSDYYAVFGKFSHGVTHNIDGYDGTKAPSGGYFAVAMNLDIQVLTDRGTVWNFGPDTTRGETSKNWSIGGGLSAMIGQMTGVTGEVHANFGSSFSIPDVSINTARRHEGVRWDVSLPDQKSTGNRAKGPSFAGCFWAFGVIFEISAETEFIMRVSPRIDWEYYYIAHERKDPGGISLVSPTKLLTHKIQFRPTKDFSHPSVKKVKPSPPPTGDESTGQTED